MHLLSSQPPLSSFFYTTYQVYKNTRHHAGLHSPSPSPPPPPPSYPGRGHRYVCMTRACHIMWIPSSSFFNKRRTKAYACHIFVLSRQSNPCPTLAMGAVSSCVYVLTGCSRRRQQHTGRLRKAQLKDSDEYNELNRAEVPLPSSARHECLALGGLRRARRRRAHRRPFARRLWRQSGTLSTSSGGACGSASARVGTR